jgi:hypothetical protein
VKSLFRFVIRAALALLVLGVLVLAALYWRGRQLREDLFAALTPVAIANCELQRFGSTNDGGYVLCGNLLQDVTSAYSYGIAGVDAWGCHVAETLQVPLHAYDCFDTTAPRCTGGVAPTFHPECIGDRRETIDGRPFDTLANQLEKNGDAGKRVLVKMDVEGSEWPVLLNAPDAALEAIDQLAIEFHEVEDADFVAAAERLTKFFYVANLHQNNHVCLPGFEPFPGSVFEALLVNKRIAKANPEVKVPIPSPVDAPNNPERVDCQPVAPGSEAQRIASWLRRVAGVAGWRLFGIPFA